MSLEAQSTTIKEVVKRDGRVVKFDPKKIKGAINKAFLKGKYQGEVVVWPLTDEVKSLDGKEVNLNGLVGAIIVHLEELAKTTDDMLTIEQVQDVVVHTLKGLGYGKVATRMRTTAIIVPRYVRAKPLSTKPLRRSQHLMTVTLNATMRTSMVRHPWDPCCCMVKKQPRTITSRTCSSLNTLKHSWADSFTSINEIVAL